MDAALVCNWSRRVWDRRTGALLQQVSLLVWNSFHRLLGDETKMILKEMKINLAITTGALTSVPQLLDVSVNKPFTDIRKLYT
jgi:hypothetical protein